MCAYMCACICVCVRVCVRVCSSSGICDDDSSSLVILIYLVSVEIVLVVL